MAYWQINHGTDPHRAMSSRPASYNDLLHALMLSRGIDPAEAVAKHSPNGRRNRATRPARRRPVVTVHGGQSTPAAVAMGERFHNSGFAGDWRKRTGSDASAISWAMESD